METLLSVCPKSSNSSICNLLSINMLGLVFEFCNLNMNFLLFKVNKKFRKVLQNSTFIKDFITESKIFLKKKKKEKEGIFNTEPSFFTELTNKLRIKYSSVQVDDFVTQIMNFIIKRIAKDEILGMYTNILAKNPKILKNFSDALKLDTTIIALSISYDSFGENIDEVENLSEAFKINRSITSLTIFSKSFGFNSENLKCLCEALKINRTITSLNLGEASNSLGKCPENFKYLSDALKYYAIKIADLHIWDDSIGENPENMKYLSDAFITNKTVSKLYLRSISFGENPQSMKHFSEALKINRTLINLNLFGNSLGLDPQIIQYLSEALKQNTSISILNLGQNFIGEIPGNMYYFSEALKVNRSITNLHLRYNSLGKYSENIKILREALEVNTTITELDLKGNSLKKTARESLKANFKNLKII